MSLETASYIHQLNVANPAASDKLQQGDDHIRLLKAVIKATFPNITGPVTVTQDFLNSAISAALVPFGVINAWYGDDEDVPDGWAVCNGQTVAKSDGSGNITVPDLRGRVIVGANATHLQGTTWGQASKTVTSEAGGAHSHVGTNGTAGGHSHGAATGGTALTLAQMPAHTHTTTGNPGGSAGSNVEIGSGGATSAIPTSSAGSGQAHTHSITAEGDHTHSLTVDAVPGHTHSVTVDVDQASMALHYIIKI